MTLLGDFFSVVARENTDDAVKCQVQLCGNHFIYKAHFPGNPVTPGVCLVQMATELLQDNVGRRLDLMEISKIKYRNVVRPCDKPWFELCHPAIEGDTCKVRVNISGQGQEYAQMSLVYRLA